MPERDAGPLMLIQDLSFQADSANHLCALVQPAGLWMGREINRACELVCDETVIKMLDESGRRAYGDTLLHAMGTGGNYKNPLASVTLKESAELLKERLGAIALVYGVFHDGDIFVPVPPR